MKYCTVVLNLFVIGKGGSVGNVTDSCRGEYSCKSAGGYGLVGSITGSCFQHSSCFHAGRSGGYVGSILDSCFNEQSCKDAGSYGGYVGSISGSCGQVKSCYFAPVNIIIMERSVQSPTRATTERTPVPMPDSMPRLLLNK